MTRALRIAITLIVSLAQVGATAVLLIGVALWALFVLLPMYWWQAVKDATPPPPPVDDAPASRVNVPPRR